MTHESDKDRSEILSLIKDYQKAIETGTREQAEKFCAFPLCYIDDDEVRMCDHYPYNPVRLREVLGFTRADLISEIVHMSDKKAHVLMRGKRRRNDDSIIEGIEAVYILQKKSDAWKIVAFSGVRS